MKRIKLTVAYDGTNYHGWQVQPNGITIEGVLNQAITALTGEPAAVIGASRTDAGVHALGNIAVFDTNTKIPPEKLSYALNQYLPEDIVVQHSCEVPSAFHPRRCESRKTYVYKILNRTFPLPLNRRDCYFTYRKLDVGQMRQAAGYLVGTHDFQSFCSVHSQAETTVRTIYHLAVEKEQDLLTIQVTGSGFLYNMVRILAGTLLQVGMGERSPAEIPDILKARNRSAAGPTAPAHGLTMIGISYNILENI
ncbi:MAG: tRNA pseudouridine(38-40) synthase TruA [Eubacterium sp.]|nr:tRNA pseudouridine(38-40) synthase TruA [Eubacterium sp.]